MLHNESCVCCIATRMNLIFAGNRAVGALKWKLLNNFEPAWHGQTDSQYKLRISLVSLCRRFTSGGTAPVDVDKTASACNRIEPLRGK